MVRLDDIVKIKEEYLGYGSYFVINRGAADIVCFAAVLDILSIKPEGADCKPNF